MQNKVFPNSRRLFMADLILLLTKKEKLNVTNIMLIALVRLLSVAMCREDGLRLSESIMLVTMLAK